LVDKSAAQGDKETEGVFDRKYAEETISEIKGIKSIS
jgi:hypothetical protein